MSNEEALILTAGIAGLQYAIDLKSTEGQIFLESLTPGSPVRMEREADNRYDRWAVAFYDQKSNRKLGYLSRYKNESIARLLDAGVKLTAVIAEEAGTMPLQGKKSPTENLMIPVNVYLVSNPAVAETMPQPSNVDLKLQAELTRFFAEAEELDRVYCTKLKTAAERNLEELAIRCVFADNVLVWQEAELLEIYLNVRISEEELREKGWRGKQEQDLTWQLEQLFYRPDCDKNRIYSFSREYVQLAEDFGKAVLSCDQCITTEEREVYHNEIIAKKKDLEKRIPDPAGFSYTEQQIIELREHLLMLDFSANGVSANELVKQSVDERLKDRELSAEQEDIYRRIFESDYEGASDGAILMVSNKESKRGRELQALVDEVSQKILEACLNQEVFPRS